MSFKKIQISEITGVCSWFKNINGVIRIPTIEAKISVGFYAILTIFYCVSPLLFASSLMSTGTRNGKDVAEKVYGLCLVIPITVVYFLLTYKKFLTPIVKSWRNALRNAKNPQINFCDPRRPVLLLRSFLSDREENNLGRIIQRTPEEDLVAALSVAGPVITAGQPGEGGHPLLGAARIYLENDWDKSILELLKIANVIVIDASNTKSLAWEMQCVRNLAHPRRVLISFLAKQDAIDDKTTILEPKRNFELFYRGFSNTFQQTFGSSLPEFDSNTFLIQFDDNWNPHAIKFLPNSINQSKTMKYVPVNDLLKGLSSFLFNLEAINHKEINNELKF
jgi:hypothetical protein